MALLSYTVTMTGSAVQATTSGSAAPNHQPVKYLRIENEIGNAAVKYGKSTVTSSVYQRRLTSSRAAYSLRVMILMRVAVWSNRPT